MVRRILIHFVLAVALTFGVASACALHRARTLDWVTPITIETFDAEWFAAECPYDDVTYLSDISTSVQRISFVVGLTEETIRFDAPGCDVILTRRQLPTSAFATYVAGTRYQSGWPVRCFEATRWSNGPETDVRVTSGIELEPNPTALSAALSRFSGATLVPVLPLRPLVTPFLVNIAFWMWCTMTLHALFTAIVRRRRIRTRKCAACGHAIVCSECGAGSFSFRGVHD